jgi:hypothetical protein
VNHILHFDFVLSNSPTLLQSCMAFNKMHVCLCCSDLEQQWRNGGGPACVLGVGTANPANCVQQDEYTDWYFRITKSDHLTDTKATMKKMCK